MLQSVMFDHTRWAQCYCWLLKLCGNKLQPRRRPLQPPRQTGAFDTTKLSNASFTEGDDISVYFQGCLWGGRIPEVLDLINELDRRIDEDYEKDIIATWHDESHLNKFYSQNREDVFVVHPSFAYPEVFADSCTFDPKIVHLSKDNSKYHV